LAVQLWLLIVAVWWLTGIAGLAYSFASLRTALGMRRVGDGDTRLTDMALYLAIARLTLFCGPFLGGPIFFNMFRLRGDVRLTDVVPIVLPFGIILLGAMVMLVATAVTLLLAVIEVRGLMRGGDDADAR
jgi:hypothetical protein